MAEDKKLNLELPHQTAGTEFLRSRENAALFDEQGLGKSKQVIDAVTAEISESKIQGALIVCPNGLKSNWGEEIERFSTLSYAIFGSGRKARRATFQSLNAAFYVINYEAVASELASLRALLRFKPMAIVLDESHRIKTPDAKITRALVKLKDDARRRFILTGTPVANKPEDLWSQVFFLDNGEAFGETFQAFRDRYCTSDGGYKSVDALRDRLSAISIRRLKDHVVDLPQKSTKRIFVELSDRQRSMYCQLRDELEIWVRNLDGEEVLKNAEAILARLVRLAQLASNPALLDSDYNENPGKFATLDSLLSEYMATPGQKVIVWTSFVDNVKALALRYADYSPVVLHGKLTNAERDDSVHRFRRNSKTRLLVANPAAAREGLTLTEANIAIYVDRTFNLVDYLQSQDRIHRISQTQPCEIVLLLASSTIDEFIDFSLEQKHRLARFAQSDVDKIEAADLVLQKPQLLQALLSPQS